ncbi:MAG: haloacid dehalogenase-like hydrolase [Epsilonproteobacteria bacterium]|nr:haloacid dehalogenase-like hydrolase [Campylobacterota bacterium]
MDKTLLIIDLDGTFVSVNTFHKWMKFLFLEELKRFHFISIVKILYTIFLRLIKKITHKQMKFTVLKISEKNINKKQIARFVDTLDTYVNQTILKNLHHTDNRTLLATAAPLLYAEAIKDKYQFDDVIATPYTTVRVWKENIKEEKKNAYLKFLQTHALHPSKVILYTDHHDDFPLMAINDFTYLVQPSERTIMAARESNIPFEVM